MKRCRAHPLAGITRSSKSCLAGAPEILRRFARLCLESQLPWPFPAVAPRAVACDMAATGSKLEARHGIEAVGELARAASSLFE